MNNDRVAEKARTKTPEGMWETGVRVAATTCEKNEDGTWSVVVRARRPTAEESETLKRLFPDLTEQAWGLLHKQALLSAMVE